MATLTINFTEGSGADGYIVKYRVKGSSDAYTTVSPNPTTTPVVITGLLPNTEYEGTITSNCVGEFNTVTNFYSCTCPTGYSTSEDQMRCEKLETTAPTITSSNVCLVASKNSTYSSYFTRIYNPGFNNSSIGMVTAPAGDVYAELTSVPLWKSSSPSDGPMNRASVWLDANCDGVVDSPGTSIKTTISFTYTSSTPSRTIYMGLGGDNQFEAKVNGMTVALTTAPTNPENFRIWHVIPITLLQGDNFFNVVGTSDGSIADAIAMTIYDNTSSELVAASSLANLNILFSSESLIGNHIDIVTCPTGYSLDTTGGTSTCKKITRTNCTGVSV